MTSAVRPVIAFSKASCTTRSEAASKAEVASSSIKICNATDKYRKVKQIKKSKKIESHFYKNLLPEVVGALLWQ